MIWVAVGFPDTALVATVWVAVEVQTLGMEVIV
jgi:hypothetical protein